MIKLLACDIDGTLLPAGQDSVPPRIIELLNTIMKKGIKLAIASGRSLYDIRRLFAELDIKPCIISDDGALAVDMNRVIYSRPLLHSDISALIREYRSRCVPVILSSASGSYMLENGADSEILIKYEINSSSVRIPSISCLKEPIYKISFLWNGELPSHPSIPKNTRIYYCKNGWLEYIPRLADKGSAISALQSLCFADSFDTLAIGNASNDIGMIKKAGYSVCIGNSCPRLSAACRLTVESILPVLEKLAGNPTAFKLH